MTFEYCQRVMVEAELDIPDIGECALLARTDLGEEYYLLIRSESGFCDIVEYGPSIPDLKVLPANVTYTYEHFEWSQYKLQKKIDKFLNNPKRGITQAENIECWQALEHIKSPAHVLFSEDILFMKDQDEDDLLDEE